MIEGTGNEGGIDRRLVDLAADSVRVKALVRLNERTASATQLASELGVDPAVMTGHLKKMLDQGLIEVVADRSAGGTGEFRYRALVRALWSNEEWAALSLEERRQLGAWLVKAILADADESLESGLFAARDDSHASRSVAVVDERGWRDLVRIHSEALEASFAVQAESAERLAESGEDGITVMSATLCCEMPAPGRS
ncbi:MAG TPA: winged helix-turn-helix domain-containing protein [Solirubrobacterales bacterium]|nr:winged helix-turn-helix domain-containing protein [Solirubrobacterales bacterium]